MTKNNWAQQRLLEAIKAVLPTARPKIEQLKKSASEFEKPDFIWEGLLRSMASLGSSRGARMMREQDLHNRVQWDALLPLRCAERRAVLVNTMSEATVRMAERKARWLTENFDEILRSGGPEVVKAELEACEGRGAKIAFLRQFRGIGPKYGRNLLMDVYHPDFRDSIALDLRIDAITKELGLSFLTYAEGEQFYLDVAHAAGLNGWELDRLLYNFNKEVLTALGNAPKAAKPKFKACRAGA